MARVWIYDRAANDDYKDSVKNAKKAKRMPPKRWQVRWYDDNNKPKTAAFAKKVDAEAKASEIESTLHAGTYRDPKAGKTPFKDVCESWLINHRDTKPSTRRTYRRLLDGHCLPRWGNVAVSAIDFERYASWITSLERDANAKPKDTTGLGASQIHSIHTVMVMVLDWAIKSKLITQNPVKGMVSLPRIVPTDHVYLTHQQIERLAVAGSALITKRGHSTAAARINRALILTLAYTGIRIGEAAALHVRSVNLTSRRLFVTATFIDAGGYHEGPPKNGTSRAVPIAGFLVRELEKLVTGRDPDEYLFTTDSGKPIRVTNWRNREFNRAVDAAGLAGRGITPHKLRHTAASLAIAAGADVYVVQRMLGHAKPSITLDVYGHLWHDRLDEVSQILDAKRSEALAAVAATGAMCNKCVMEGRPHETCSHGDASERPLISGFTDQGPSSGRSDRTRTCNLR
ncbi:tyrosine-type recombinase/integrase, partial [Stackebrandtia soli]|uniref:tyrosine-type recombinase/integrase n=1 Tax=Stackebrandtia soli TaxID=1892856 RepID=UPI0039EA106D